MAFYARNFVFDNIPSETHGLIISSSDGGEGTTAASNDVTLRTQAVFKRPVPYFYGVGQENILEFDAEISTTETEITAVDSAIIESWLFGQMNYKKLRIVQYDMEDIYFNCFLKNPQVKRVGNIIRGYSFTVVCDSPFAWSTPKSVTYSATNTTSVLYNLSENLYYTHPSLVITMSGLGGDFLIRNVTDNNRTFEMTGLLSNEVVTIDCDLQIVTSDQTSLILNKITEPVQFFRLVKGINKIYVEGDMDSVKITYTPMKRI